MDVAFFCKLSFNFIIYSFFPQCLKISKSVLPIFNEIFFAFDHAARLGHLFSVAKYFGLLLTNLREGVGFVSSFSYSVENLCK